MFGEAVVGRDELFGAVRRVLGDGRFDDALYLVLDLLGVADLDVDEVALDSIAAYLAGAALRVQPLCVAIVALSPGAVALANRLCVTVRPACPTARVPTTRDAREWIRSVLPGDYATLLDALEGGRS